MKIMRTAGFMAAAILTTACGSKDAPATDESAAAAAAAEVQAEHDPKADYIKACQLKSTAPEVREWTTYWDPRGKRNMGQGPSWAQSTYWGDERERKSLMDSKLPPLEFQCSVEKEDGGYEIAVQIHALGMGEADVPLGPGTYPIVPSGEDRPKGFTVWPLMYGDAGNFQIKGGSVTVTRFDDKGLAGSFVVEAQEVVTGDRPLRVEGTFDMPCRGGPAESACKANKRIVE